jgi:uncharacterized membrane protein YcaP (DUF421 family)
MDAFYIFVRSIAAFLILLFITRKLGKQTLSNITFHDFVTAIVLGAISANLAFNEKIQVWHLLISFFVFTSTSWVLSKIALKSRLLRKWISGTPSVLIQDGRILEKNMKINQCTMDSLNMMLREKDIYDIEEVKYAVLEDNGKLSLMKKQPGQGQKPYGSHFPIELIMDGRCITANLQNGLSYEWLQHELKQRGKRMEDVFYAVRGSNNQLYFDYYDDHIKRPVDSEKGSLT